MRARILTSLTLLAMLAITTPMATFARQAGDPEPGGKLPLPLEAPKIDPELLSGDGQSGLSSRDGKLRVLVELQAAPTARVYADSLKGGDKNKAAADAKTALADIDAAQRALQRTLQSPSIGAQVLSRTQRVFNGLALRVDRSKLGAIARLSGVKAITPVREITLDNAAGVPLVQAPAVWSSAAAGNALGDGMRIGVIDTGIDYLHTDFGGPGTPESYTNNDTTVLGDAPFPSAKVGGGYDFVGDAYDAGSDDPAISTPQPDPDPLDCNGHGSHVAGSAAGYGVNADGSSYAGPWNAGIDFDAFKIGPGVAPRAVLWGLRVFGCAGSSGTDVILQAIERATDPNQDGNFADRLDVINMSLGSNFGDPFEPDVIAVNNATDVGVLAAVAAGNDGDTFYIMGGPGSADKAITVGGVTDELNVIDGFVVNTPATIAGVKPGLNSIAFNWNPPSGPVAPISGDLVYPPTQRSGCQAFTPANATLMAGKIALLDWTETSPGVSECGSVARVTNAANAGAIGVVYDYGQADFDGGFTGSTRIPSIFTTQAVGQQLKAALAGGATVNVTLTDEYNAQTKTRFPGQTDSVYTSTSRGPASGTSALKPDIAAPAVTLFSADALSGTEGAISSGTSMATPHVAGAMALLRQIHPNWSIEELKALAMNTASAPVRANDDPASLRMAPQRVGSNRMTLAEAIASPVVAYNADDDGRVSVSFGAVEVLNSRTAVKNVTVANKGTAAASYTLSYQAATDVPGVTFSVAPASITIPAGRTANFTVTMTADAAAMNHGYDPTITLTQQNLPRHWITEESGHAILTPTAGATTTLRVPVYAAARAASEMHATSYQAVVGNAATANVGIELQGTPVGSGQALLTASPTDEMSLVTAFELQHSSPNEAASGPPNERSDIQYVGVFSDYPATNSMADTMLAFGISTYGDWTTPQGAITQRFTISIDTNRDGTFDYELYNFDYATLTGSTAQSDVFLAVLENLNDPSADLALQFVNGISPETLNTVPYNTNVLMLPVLASDLGLTDAAATFDYQVASTDINADGAVETTPKLTYNAAKPGVDLTAGFAGLPTFTDLPGTTIPVKYSQADFAAAKSQGVLLLHHYNTSGRRADAVRLVSAIRVAMPGISSGR